MMKIDMHKVAQILAEELVRLENDESTAEIFGMGEANRARQGELIHIAQELRLAKEVDRRKEKIRNAVKTISAGAD